MIKTRTETNFLLGVWPVKLPPNITSFGNIADVNHSKHDGGWLLVVFV
jgi:hypothetical protein